MNMFDALATSAHGHGGPGEPPSPDDDDGSDDEVPWC